MPLTAMAMEQIILHKKWIWSYMSTKLLHSTNIFGNPEGLQNASKTCNVSTDIVPSLEPVTKLNF